VDHTFPDTHFHIKDFRLHRNDRDCFGGGEFIYARRGLIVTRIHDLEEHKVGSITTCVCKYPGERKRCFLSVCTDHQACFKKALWKNEILSIRLRATVRRYNANWRPKLRPLPARDKGTKEGKTLMDLMVVYGLTLCLKYQLV